MKATFVKFRPFNKGKRLGFANIGFSLRDGGDAVVFVNGFTVFRDDQDGGISVAMPATKEKDKDGNDKYWPVIFPKKENAEAEAWVRHITEAVQVELNKTSSNNQLITQSQPKDSSGNTTYGGFDDGIPF